MSTSTFHSLLDLVLIDEKTGLPLLRPCVTACIDDYSRFVVNMACPLSAEPRFESALTKKDTE